MAAAVGPKKIATSGAYAGKQPLGCSNENYRLFLFVFFFAKIAFQFSL